MTLKAAHILEKIALHPKTLRHASREAFKKYLNAISDAADEAEDNESWKNLVPGMSAQAKKEKYWRQAKSFAWEAKKRQLKGINKYGPIGALSGALVGAAIPVGKIKKDSALEGKEKRQLHTIAGALSGYLAGQGTKKLVNAYNAHKFMKNVTKVIK